MLPTAHIRYWQTTALLLLGLGFALAPVSLAGYLTPAVFMDWPALLVPFGMSLAVMHRGRYRLAALCGVAASCVAGVLCWWMVYVAVSGILTTGLTGTTAVAVALVVTFVCLMAAISSATGALWCLPDRPRSPALRATHTRRAIAASPEP
jgi:hypothetical protein